jgi:cyanate lyase
LTRKKYDSSNDVRCAICAAFFMQQKISIEKCRQILGKTDLTDQEIEMIRDSLYSWLERFLDQHFQDSKIQ